MATFVGVGGVNKTVSGISVGVGGAWKTVIKGWVGVGGVWKVFHEVVAGGSVAVSDWSVNAGTTSPADATALYEINTDGKIYEAVNNAPKSLVETWLLSGLSSDYEVQAVVTAGTLTSGTTDTWISLGSGSMGWTKVRTANTDGTDTCTFTLSIRRVSDLVVVDTASITLNATVSL